jgi:hypothetical protein
MAFATAIPALPNGSWPIYNEVEGFLLEQRELLDVGGQTVLSFKQIVPSFEEVGRLTRLAQDLRSDAGHLEQLAESVEELLDQCVDELRNAEARGEA